LQTRLERPPSPPPGSLIRHPKPSTRQALSLSTHINMSLYFFFPRPPFRGPPPGRDQGDIMDNAASCARITEHGRAQSSLSFEKRKGGDDDDAGALLARFSLSSSLARFPLTKKKTKKLSPFSLLQTAVSTLHATLLVLLRRRDGVGTRRRAVVVARCRPPSSPPRTKQATHDKTRKSEQAMKHKMCICLFYFIFSRSRSHCIGDSDGTAATSCTLNSLTPDATLRTASFHSGARRAARRTRATASALG
jgi:hypothetical protein